MGRPENRHVPPGEHGTHADYEARMARRKRLNDHYHIE